MTTTMPLGSVPIARAAVEAAYAAARRYAPEILANVEAYQTVQAWLESMASAEQKLEELRLRLERMNVRGYARPEDFAAYELLRDNVYAMHVKADRALRSAFGSTLSQFLPTPKKAPAVTRTPTTVAGLRAVPQRSQAPAFGLAGAGLGSPSIPAAGGAAAAAGLAPWMWAAIVIAVALAVIVAAVMIGGAFMADSVRDTVVNHDFLDRQAEVWRLRDEYMQHCMEQGASAADCTAQAVQLYPPPRLAPLPKPNTWVKWVAAAVITVTVVGAGIYFWRSIRSDREGSDLSGGRAPRARFKRMSPREFTRSSGDYGLEVEEDDDA